MAIYRAPRGNQLTCANWQIEAAYRMVQNNLDRDVAEDPERLWRVAIRRHGGELAVFALEPDDPSLN